MEFEYTLENERQFWDELDEILNKNTHEHIAIDDALRNYLSFVIQFKNEYLNNEYEVLRCAYRLISSPIYNNEQEYVRTQIVYCLLQEDSPEALHVIAAFVLFDGRQHETTFETLNEEGGFSRIVELLQEAHGKDEPLHRLLLELMFEMCRIQRVKHHDLFSIDEDFILSLLKITEGLSADVEDPYHYYVIRVLVRKARERRIAYANRRQLVLNEQYMVRAHEPSANGTQWPSVPNLVISTLSKYGSFYKTFGENIILLLNRESETSLQLLILKLLYLLFTTHATYEYFYTNDLRVLVDVMIRNLLDLAFSSTALRHTYLRVLHPLLAHTQLKYPDNNYKRDELLKLLNVMGGNTSVGGFVHFGGMDETTRRLVKRCMTVEWISEADDGAESPKSSTGGSPRMQHLQIGLNPEASRSTLSVAEVSSQHARPGEHALSRGEELARQQAALVGPEGVGAAPKGSARINGETLEPPASIPRLKSPFETEVEG